MLVTQADDPMKIGKYGLGFKSVFHLTGTTLMFVKCLIYSYVFIMSLLYGP